MRRILSAVAALAAVAVVAATPASAARTTPSYTLSGIETGIPQATGGDESTSPFAGVAFSSTAGYATWTADVTHHALDSTDCGLPSLTGCITGGDFSLSGKKTITGTFTGGSISLISPPGTCTPTAVYAVTGEVDLNRGYGAATFTAVLTHYQVWLFGTCVPYFATVTGTFG